jgi:hypothetical protein
MPVVAALSPPRLRAASAAQEATPPPSLAAAPPLSSTGGAGASVLLLLSHGAAAALTAVLGVSRGAVSALDAATAAVSAAVVLGWFAIGTRWLLRQPWARSDGRARAWLIQALVAAVMGPASLPFVAAALRSDDAGFVALTHEDTPLSRELTIFFTVATALDLAIGAAAYPEHVELVSGYLHHGVFILVSYYPLTTNTCGAFLAHTIIELPTLVLAVGVLVPALRADYLFGASFFLLRIVYFFFSLAWHHRLARERYIVYLTAFCALLHCAWFASWSRGMLRRGRKAAGLATSPGASPAPEAPASASAARD